MSDLSQLKCNKCSLLLSFVDSSVQPQHVTELLCQKCSEPNTLSLDSNSKDQNGNPPHPKILPEPDFGNFLGKRSQASSESLAALLQDGFCEQGSFICLDPNCRNPDRKLTCDCCYRHECGATCDQQLRFSASELVERAQLGHHGLRKKLEGAFKHCSQFDVEYLPAPEILIQDKIQQRIWRLSNFEKQISSLDLHQSYSFKKEGDYIIVHDKVLEEVEKILVEMLACHSSHDLELITKKWFNLAVLLGIEYERQSNRNNLPPSGRKLTPPREAIEDQAAMPLEDN